MGRIFRREWREKAKEQTKSNHTAAVLIALVEVVSSCQPKKVAREYRGSTRPPPPRRSKRNGSAICLGVEIGLRASGSNELYINDSTTCRQNPGLVDVRAANGRKGPKQVCQPLLCRTVAGDSRGKRVQSGQRAWLGRQGVVERGGGTRRGKRARERTQRRKTSWHQANKRLIVTQFLPFSINK